MTTLKIIGERPADIPKDWLIFNAPRPLYGDKCWQAEFQHGIFYAALDPADRYFERSRSDNLSLDGWLLEYVTEAEVMAWAKVYYAEYGIDLSEVDRGDILAGWFQNCAVTK